MQIDRRLPLISVILPVFNGQSTLDRALRSVQVQTSADWEVVAVDDGSTDGTYEALQGWAAKDSRVRVVRLDENRGPGAARNAGLQVARGEWIAYLDHDDEYCSDYLEHVATYRGTAGVLVFGYDIVTPDAAVNTWSPATSAHEIFSTHIAMPMAIAHPRQVAEKAGGFNELVWWEEDAELLRRLVRAGVEIHFVPHKSGRYHVRGDSRRRLPRLTRSQRTVIEANWNAGRSIFTPAGSLNGDAAGTTSAAGHDQPSPSSAVGVTQTPGREIRKILFASPYSVIDYTSGAAIATVTALRFLKQLGFDCQAFCGSYLDTPQEGLLEEMLVRQNSRYETQLVRVGQFPARLIRAMLGTIPVTIFRSLSTLRTWVDEAEVSAFLQVYAQFLDENRPDAVWTYGGDAAADMMIKLAKDRDIPVIFGLHNFGYNDPGNFASVDYVTVPSDFSRRYYWESLGLACHTLPYAIDWQRIQVTDHQPRHVTIVNPQPEKGLFVFARIAQVLASRRPDIRLLVVEGRSCTGWRQQTGIDLEQLPNVTAMSSTGDPRNFYSQTKLLLMPSLWNESFGLVAAEAMINGIPVLVSNRGALPGTVGDAGFVFDIPGCYQPQTTVLPMAEEVEPWVEKIIRLWDDVEYYQQASAVVRQHAERWRPERMADAYRQFFGSLVPQPGPPLVPKRIAQ